MEGNNDNNSDSENSNTNIGNNSNNRPGSSRPGANNQNARSGSSNSTSRPGSYASNPRPDPSNVNPRPGPSNENSRLPVSNGISRPSLSSNQWAEKDRDRKIPKKRSHSDGDGWVRDNKLKREASDPVKKEENCDNVNEISNDMPLSNLQEMARASQQLAIQVSQQQQMGMAMPQQPQMIHQQPIPYPSYGYSAPESYMDPNQGAYAMSSFPPMMPITSQWPPTNGMPATASNVAATSGMGYSNGMEMMAPSSGGMGPYPYMNMGSSDGSLYGMVPVMQNYAPYPVMPNNADSIVPMFNNLEPITVTNAVLTPPLPGERRTRREKPNGCRTVFVGNMPEKITEEIIKDVFKICGPISVVRMSKKNFCHIRFQNMESVDQAMLLSGFRIRIEENEDQAYNGKLHVDYAVARDDQHDYECLERARLREERHRQQDFRPPSPPPVPHFSDHEAQALAERLRNEDTFRDALLVLITWLERGECNKKSAGTFYSLIQSSHSHVKRLRNERVRCDEEVKKANEKLMLKNRAISTEITEIEKVFKAARTQKVWDHFTKSQRKKMEEMKIDTNDLKETNSGFLIRNRDEQEMELSDNEDRNDSAGMLELAPAEELSMLRERVNSMTEELLVANQTIEEYKGHCSDHENQIVKLKNELEDSKKLEKAGNISPDSFEERSSYDSATQYSPSRVDVSDDDSQLIALISVFLNAHPFGASIDYICSFAVVTIPSVNARDIEGVMRRYPRVFRELSTGIGATLEKKWIHVAFGNWTSILSKKN